MNKHNPRNERIKRQYFTFLKEAKRQSESSVDAVAKALNRFEVYTKYRDYKAFHFQQAVAFKKHLTEQKGHQSRKKLSKATLNSTLSHLKRFFQWLAGQPGYKSRLQYSDAEYFNLSEKDTRVATAQREKPVPTLEQINHVLNTMSNDTEIEMRNRALIAITLLTGARDSAIASMKLKHIDLSTGSIFQDAREVRTKFSKTFTTYFFPVGEEIRQIVSDWVDFLREEMLWSNDDPLFPATCVVQGSTRRFEAAGLERKHWSTAAPIRTIFRNAFSNADLPYFNPHSFRNTLVRLGETICQTPEDFKAWSQNLGHEGVLTTFYSYGNVSTQRQGEIVQRLASKKLMSQQPAVKELAKELAREMAELR
ncbi:MAG: tyrosine-type recombinase/integrase [Candidatus Thiodiazotropha sp. (ex Codakia rugifera)]|nr:tyrosine-type recombinase/integrase [Candidatus Thiodiazotropha sp. (ex Codakia rugifera)]